MAFLVKWLFLIGLSAVGAVLVTVLSSLAAGRHPLATLELSLQHPGILIMFFLAWGAWMGLTNDIAAGRNMSRLLGQRVEFREIALFSGLENSTDILPFGTKVCVAYPALIAFAFLVLTSMTSRM
jgi:hypothetical protein